MNQLVHELVAGMASNDWKLVHSSLKKGGYAAPFRGVHMTMKQRAILIKGFLGKPTKKKLYEAENMKNFISAEKKIYKNK